MVVLKRQFGLITGGALTAGGLACLGFILAAVIEPRVPNATLSTGSRTIAAGQVVQQTQ